MALLKHIKENINKRSKPWIVNRDFYCYKNPKLPKEEVIKLKESGIVKGKIISDYGEF